MIILVKTRMQRQSDRLQSLMKRQETGKITPTSDFTHKIIIRLSNDKCNIFALIKKEVRPSSTKVATPNSNVVPFSGTPRHPPAPGSDTGERSSKQRKKERKEKKRQQREDNAKLAPTPPEKSDSKESEDESPISTDAIDESIWDLNIQELIDGYTWCTMTMETERLTNSLNDNDTFDEAADDEAKALGKPLDDELEVSDDETEDKIEALEREPTDERTTRSKTAGMKRCRCQAYRGHAWPSFVTWKRNSAEWDPL
ncbi:unnamed protein product [Clonostachys chloroleuca]|uniref:Uncharacterized protein n=1 Tax=Clonostachys chloroleuca TaxID=1926264 RepID=A0AA35MED8_9HYPO|nr:unnamed protein product [Clonostachys chloroleuca]